MRSSFNTCLLVAGYKMFFSCKNLYLSNICNILFCSFAAMLSTAVLCLSLIFMVSPSTSQQPLTSNDPQQKIFSSHSHPSWSLGLQVYKALRSEGSYINTLISPLLLANALSALSHAAKGSTARQLQELLKTDKDENQTEKSSSRPFASIRTANGTSYTLHGSSAIFSKQVPTLESGFLDKLKAQFEVDHVALGAGDKQRDIEKLSSWAKSGLGGVKEMPLNGGPDAKEGALILASALHFKGEKDKDPFFITL